MMSPRSILLGVVFLVVAEGGNRPQQPKDQYAEFEAFAGGDGGIAFVLLSAAGKQNCGNNTSDRADQCTK